MTLALALALAVLCAGCDRHRYEYVEQYQESACASLDVGGRRVLLTARATFADARPAPAVARDRHPDAADMTADDRYRYAKSHPEIYGPIGSREEYAEQFGEPAASEGPWSSSEIEIVMSGDYEASFTIAAQAPALSREGRTWTALDIHPTRLSVGRRAPGQEAYTEGAPVRLRFPALPQVAPVRERLPSRQIDRKPAPSARPFALTLRLEHDGPPQTVTLTFARVAQHPPFPPNPFYWLYAAH